MAAGIAEAERKVKEGLVAMAQNVATVQAHVATVENVKNLVVGAALEPRPQPMDQDAPAEGELTRRVRVIENTLSHRVQKGYDEKIERVVESELPKIRQDFEEAKADLVKKTKKKLDKALDSATRGLKGEVTNEMAEAQKFGGRVCLKTLKRTKSPWRRSCNDGSKTKSIALN